MTDVWRVCRYPSDIMDIQLTKRTSINIFIIPVIAPVCRYMYTVYLEFLTMFTIIRVHVMKIVIQVVTSRPSVGDEILFI